MKAGTEKRSVNLSRMLALRYIGTGSSSNLVSFMSRLSIIGLVFGISILVTALSVLNGFDVEMRQRVLGIFPHLTVTSSENLDTRQWQEINASLRSMPGITSLSPVIEVGAIVATDSGNRGVAVTGVDPATDSSLQVLAQFFDSGSLESLSDGRWGVVIGQSLADHLDAEVGDSINLFAAGFRPNPLTPLPIFRQFEVRGIFKVGTDQLDSQLAVVNLADARALFRLRSAYNGVRVVTEDVLNADATAANVRAVLPAGASVSSWTAQFGSIYENIVFSRSIIAFLLWLLIVVAAFNLVVSLIMVVRDKRGDIAILKTMGASNSSIRSAFMWQGMLIVVISLVLGLGLGLAGATQVTSIAAYLESLFSVSLLNAEVYPLDYLPSQVLWTDLLLITAGVLLLCLIATVIPASRAANVQPASALRSE